MATFADQNAVAASQRSWHQLTPRGPWADEFEQLLDELVQDKLPQTALAILGPKLEQRKQQRQQLAAERRLREQALARLDGVEDRIAALNAAELDQVEQDLDAAWPGHDPRRSQLRRLISSRREELTNNTE